MIIAIDVDDVLGDFSEAFIKFIKHQHDVNVDIHNLKVAQWWQAWGHTQEEANAMIFDFLESDEVMHIKPKTGAVRALKILKHAGHVLYVITGRPAKGQERTKQWVHDNMPEVFEKIFCTDFHLVSGGEMTKGSICKQIGAQALVDDFPGYAEECLAAGVRVLLFDSFWNQGYALLAGMTRVHNWDEVIREIEKLNK